MNYVTKIQKLETFIDHQINVHIAETVGKVPFCLYMDERNPIRFLYYIQHNIFPAAITPTLTASKPNR